MTNNIFIDCQILQTADGKRGMGLYLYNLIDNLPNKSTNLTFILTKDLPIEKSIQDFLKKRGKVILSNLKTKSSLYPTYLKAFDSNREELIRSLPIKALKDSLFFIPALFSDSIYPVFPADNSLFKAILIHDLIPYLFHENYFPDKNSVGCQDYLERYRTFYDSDYYFTNSYATANDLATHLGISEDMLVPILGSGSSRSKLHSQKPNLPDRVLENFILMPSGDDFRKNNLAAVKALSIINNKSSKKYSLLVTSSFSEGTKSNLKSVSKDIHFTGVISEEELLYLLQKSALVMFPTLYEGLGMPILEARETGAKVVCSNLEVFKEISDGTLNYFNPKDYTDIARAINTALKKKGSRGTMNKEYTWPEVAKKFLSFASSLKNKINTPKKRLAVFTPSPSSRSAIGLVTHYSHSELSKLYNVDYFFEDGLYNYKPSRLNTIKYCQREQNKKTLLEAVLANKYDKVIYHLANSEFHVHSILTALKHPGTIILHDTQLKGIFDLMVNRAIIPPERYVASRSIMELSGNDGRSGFIETLINNQNNIICHSEYAKGALADILDTPKTRITKLNLPVRVPTIYPEKASNKGGLTVGFGGILSADKGLELLEKVLKIKGVNATIFGFSGFSESFAKKYKNKINLKTNLTDYEFIQTTKSMDLTINYRKHYNGETSISVLEALSCGTPSIVKDMGWYSELPNKVAFKAKDEDQIVQYIKESIKSREGRGTKNYINYIKYNHSIRKYVEGL